MTGSPQALAVRLASAFDGSCFVVPAPLGGAIVGAGWTGDLTGEPSDLRAVHFDQDHVDGGTMTITTSRRHAAMVPGGSVLVEDLFTLIIDAYASNISVDGLPVERMSRAHAARTARLSPATLTIDGQPHAGCLLQQHDAVVFGCELPDRAVTVYLEGNPRPQPTTLCSLRPSTR